MKTSFYFAVVCIALLFIQTPKTLFAQENLLVEVETKIKEFEANEIKTEELITTIKGYKLKFESGELLMHPGSSLALTRNEMETLINIKLLNGFIQPSEVTVYIKKAVEHSKDLAKGLGEALQETESGLRKIKDELNFLRDERTRLKGLVDCIPNVNGTFIIAGDPTGYMILTQSGPNVAGFYGNDRSNLTSTLKGVFKCDELTGTFSNNEYKITGTFKYKFSKDGSSYTGTWKNDTGGATGSNSGRKE